MESNGATGLLPRQQPVFILGLPRCRTAWLSVCLSALGVACSHEGMRDSWGDFAAYAEELDARLACGPAGDAEPGLIYFVEELLQRWPGARFLVVSRPPDAAREALAAAAISPALAAGIRAGWPGYLAVYEAACTRLRTLGERVRFMSADDFEEEAAVQEALEFLTGQRPDALWVRRMQRLRVTTAAVELLDQPGPSPRRVSLPGAEGLEAALFAEEDFPTVARWWQAHTGRALPRAALPPLGVVVRERGSSEPLAALWCYECFGVPVAELAFPVTRPGLSLRQAASALCFAVEACIAAAGKGHTPEGSFTFFKTFAPRGAVRHLKRLGFEEALTDRVAMTLSLH